MQTQLAEPFLHTPEGQEADAILRSCVHCGFCTATCPTYQLLGDEDDGPRGRIYLIKSVLEGNQPGPATMMHLDRCLTCRACETTCPSGVNYHRLLDIGRHEVEKQVRRPLRQRLMRRAVMEILSRRALFTPLYRLGQWLRPLMPKALKGKVLARRRVIAEVADKPVGQRRMVLPGGCVQPGIAPEINRAAVRVLAALGIELVSPRGEGCCGALRFHLNDIGGAEVDMKRNIDSWLPLLEQGAEKIVSTASGCGVHMKAYGELLRHDSDYASRARAISERSEDIVEVLLAEEEQLLKALEQKSGAGGRKVAFHSPCTLQHGQKIVGKVERLLTAAGFELVPVADSHLCCGSAGTYSLFEPQLSSQLRENKVEALTAAEPDVIATGNIGCLSHMAPAAEVPVVHWVELVDQVLQS